MSKQCITLRNHKAGHVVPLTVDENIFRARFAAGCSTRQCKGGCCKTGVWTDLQEHDRILEHRELILQHMDSGQQHDPNCWFEVGVRSDTDFPSGTAMGTKTHAGACVFLNAAGKCVLQIAEQGPSIKLKPFFCHAFPIFIENGELAFDEGPSPDCCALTPDGNLDIFAVCSAELLHVLGEEGVAELRTLIKSL